MNELFVHLGIEGWKPVLTALMLPPVPWLLLIVAGAWLLARQRRRAGAVLVGASVLALYSTACPAPARWLLDTLLAPPPPLVGERLASLRGDAAGTAVVVLGGGAETYAPEYGAARLNAPSLERLRYGIWLARATGHPLAFSGGSVLAAPPAAAEATVAARIAAQEFGFRMSWTEPRSRDTRENALFTTPLLKAAGVRRVLLVTHREHMPRALRNFERAARAAGWPVELVPAPIGPGMDDLPPMLRWVPSQEAMGLSRRVLREWIGAKAGA